MTAATTTKIRSNLARKMSVPGGRTVAEALAQADKGLESHREAGMVTIGKRLIALEAAVAARSPGSEPDIYRVAAELLDMAGFFDTGPLYKASFSLCDIADRMQTANVWDWPSIAVHVQAMRLILTDGCKDSATSTTILQGLAAVAQKVG